MKYYNKEKGKFYSLKAFPIALNVNDKHHYDFGRFVVDICQTDNKVLFGFHRLFEKETIKFSVEKARTDYPDAQKGRIEITYKYKDYIIYLSLGEYDLDRMSNGEVEIDEELYKEATKTIEEISNKFGVDNEN